ncbi:MAG: glycosyltransferase family 4 protein [Candidatus Omnitrophica bacterium]|nr:glycosyltransferase family 4 protein [Candidatus Omnitrophota bacterium]
MKVAILGPYPIDNKVNSINGGIQAVIVNLVKGLLKFKDLDMHIVTASHFIDKDMDWESSGVNVHAVPQDKIFGNITLYSNTRKRICKKIREIKPDIVHTHCFGYETLAALDSGHKKVIVSTHGIRNGQWGVRHNIPDSIRAYLQDCIYKRCLKRVENIVINNPYAGEHLAGFKQMKIWELDNPVSDTFFNIDNSAEENARVLFVGNVCEAKGIMTILEAMDVLKLVFPEIKLRIAGPVSGKEFYSRVTIFIKKSGLERHINFLGHLNDNELREEYQKACVFAFPSQQDVAPVALLQAMAGGKAIVATKVGGIPYIIDDGKNGFLIEKNDYRALADKISLFIKNSRLRRELGAHAKDKISKNNRVRQVSEKLYTIYNEVYKG